MTRHEVNSCKSFGGSWEGEGEGVTLRREVCVHLTGVSSGGEVHHPAVLYLRGIGPHRGDKGFCTRCEMGDSGLKKYCT